MSEERQFAFLWEIENINFCTKRKDDCIYTSDFKSENLYGTYWYLSLYPRGDEDSEDGYMACYLHRCEDDGPTEIVCEYEIQVISSEGMIVKSEKESNTFQKGDFCGFTNFWKKSLPLNDIKEVLILRCHVKSITQNIPLRLKSILKTKIEVDKYSFKWIVRKLNSNCSEVKKFPCSATSEIEIAIQVPLDEVKISINKIEGTESASVMLRMSLLDVKNGKKCDSKEALHFFDSTQNDIWKFPNFLKKSKLNAEKEKYLKDDCFTLKCEIEISDGEQTDSVEDNEIYTPGSGIKVVLEDYSRLYKDKIHADVNLFVEGGIIQAHKSILSVRSPVFMAMFNTDMVETETGSVKIPDLEAETVNFLLEYIYTGTLNKLDSKMAAKLIVAADKYQVLPLKEECADLLKWLLSHENVCNVLVVADSIQHEVLKSAAMIYIENNSEIIFLSKEWKSVVEKYVPLAAETVQKVSMVIAADKMKTEDE